MLLSVCTELLGLIHSKLFGKAQIDYPFDVGLVSWNMSRAPTTSKHRSHLKNEQKEDPPDQHRGWLGAEQQGRHAIEPWGKPHLSFHTLITQMLPNCSKISKTVLKAVKPPMLPPTLSIFHTIKSLPSIAQKGYSNSNFQFKNHVKA